MKYIFAIALGLSPLLSAAPVEVNAIAAVADGRPITKNEINFALTPTIARLKAFFPRQGQMYHEELGKQRQKILDDLISRELILSKFKELEASIPERFVDEEIQRQIRNDFKSNEEEFYQKLKTAGLDKRKHREIVRKKLIVQAMRSNHLAETSPPTPEEVRNAYDKYKILLRDVAKDKITFRKIFIPSNVPDPLATEESQLQMAEDIAAKIKGGADFSAMAKQHSADYLAEKGGQWPETPRVDLSSEFAAIIFEAKEGETLGPIKEPAGYTIVEIQNINYGPAPSFEEMKTKIEEGVKREKDSERYKAWLKRLRNNAVVVIK